MSTGGATREREIRDGLVSVIVPVFNRPGLLREAVESALAQTYRPIEVLIVDDGSDDETPAVAEQLERSHPGTIRVVRRETRGGPGLAKNDGIARSRGEFVQFLDSDDLLLPRKLEVQVELLRRRPECGVAYCLSNRVYADGRVQVSHRTDETFDSILPGFLGSRGWPTLAPLWRRADCERIGGFSSHVVLEDWLWDIKAGLSGTRVCRSPEPLCLVRDLDVPRAGRTRTGLSKEQWKAVFDVREEVVALLDAQGLRHQLGASAFARSTFQAARQCAMMGWPAEARRGLRLASSVPSDGLTQLKVLLFRLLSRIVGGRAASAVSELAWRRLGSLRGHKTQVSADAP